MDLKDVPQLYILCIGKHRYVRASWELEPGHLALKTTEPFKDITCITLIVPDTNVSVWKYPLEDGVPEFICGNGKIRVKGRI